MKMYLGNTDLEEFLAFCHWPVFFALKHKKLVELEKLFVIYSYILYTRVSCFKTKKNLFIMPTYFIIV